MNLIFKRDLDPELTMKRLKNTYCFGITCNADSTISKEEHVITKESGKCP